ASIGLRVIRARRVVHPSSLCYNATRGTKSATGGKMADDQLQMTKGTGANGRSGLARSRSLAPARSALAGFWLRPDSFRHLPGGSSHKICNVIFSGVRKNWSIQAHI